MGAMEFPVEHPRASEDPRHPIWGEKSGWWELGRVSIATADAVVSLGPRMSRQMEKAIKTALFVNRESPHPGLISSRGSG